MRTRTHPHPPPSLPARNAPSAPSRTPYPSWRWCSALGFVGSLVIYLLYKDRGPFVRAHAANSLNVQIITGIVLLISIPLMFVLIGFVTYPIALVFAFVLHLMGALKAHRGEWWNPPMTPRFVR